MGYGLWHGTCIVWGVTGMATGHDNSAEGNDMKLSMKISGLATAGAMLLALSGQVQALTLGPLDMDADGASLSSLPCLPGCIPAAGSTSFENFYSNHRGDESGSFAGSYSTAFWPEWEWDHARITHDGGAAIDCGGTCWLVIKSRETTPFYYFYELSAHGLRTAWNGTDSIEMFEFWTGPDRVKEVSIWGVRRSVPEPSTLALLGLGLAGIGFGLRRRRN